MTNFDDNSNNKTRKLLGNSIVDKTTCMTEYDPNALTVEQALSRINNLVVAIPETESLHINDILGRVLAGDVCSPVNVPNYVNSAMDGYAINYADISRQNNNKFTVCTTILAGNTDDITLKPGECARIMTGAKIPNGSDSVVMQEQTQRDGNYITLQNPVSQGQNIRYIGEDIKIDDVILRQGHQLNLADIGLLASIGVSHASVYRKIRVAYFSTGNELVALGNTLKQGQLYDSNRYTLKSMLQKFGADLIDLGVVEDNQKKIETTLQEASAIADVVITTGGVSVGEADFVKTCLDEIGAVDFWKIAMKPGRPLAFGRIGTALFFGLPGNLVSTMVTFFQFVLPALRKLSGQAQQETLYLQATCLSQLKKRKGRRDFQRGILSMNNAGNMVVQSTGMQGSHILTSMSSANCFIVLDEECEMADIGSSVKVQPFSSFF